jgi:hypothetical protein
MVQVLTACEKTLCFCFIAIVAEALELRRLPELEVTLCDFQFAPLRIDFGNQTYSPICNEMIHLTRMRMVGHLFYLESVCPDIGRHLFGKECSQRQSRSSASLKGHKDITMRELGETWNPRQTEIIVYAFPYRYSWTSNHMHQYKEPLRLCDQSSSVPSDKHLWDTEFGSNTDSSFTDSDEEARYMVGHSSPIHRDHMTTWFSTSYDKYPLPPSELSALVEGSWPKLFMGSGNLGSGCISYINCERTQVVGIG